MTCAHGRDDGYMCPWCLGINEIEMPLDLDTILKWEDGVTVGAGGPKARIRFVTQTLPSKVRSWSDIGMEYLQAIIDAGYRVRVLGTTPTDLQKPSPWESYAWHFTKLLCDSFINIVCGIGDFDRFWQDGKVNIAISGYFPRPLNQGEISSLKKYNIVRSIPEAPIPGIPVLTLDGVKDFLKGVLD